MAGNGPPPKSPDQRARRNATVAVTRLPAEGRHGKPPRWPLIDDVVLTAKRNLARSAANAAAAEVEELEDAAAAGSRVAKKLTAAKRKLREAQQGQAVLDAQLRAQRKLERDLWSAVWATPQAVAWERLGWTRDVAQYVRHKVLGELGSLDDAKEARQWSDRLGLSPQAMLRLRWDVAPDEVGQQREQQDAAASAPPTTTGSRARYGALKAVGGS